MIQLIKSEIFRWICIGFVLIGTTKFILPRVVVADFWGGDVVVLSQILVKTIEQIAELRSIIGNTHEAVSILNEMNRGVQETLRLARTAHIPLPPQIYAQAKSIEQATAEARALYGDLPDTATTYGRNEFQSGAEGVSLSEDTVDYSAFLDSQGETIKSSAVVASSAAATRLTAESLGVVIHAINQGNRIGAKNLEYASTDRIKSSATDAARMQSFLETEEALRNDLSDRAMTPLNSIFDESVVPPGSGSGGRP